MLKLTCAILWAGVFGLLAPSVTGQTKDYLEVPRPMLETPESVKEQLLLACNRIDSIELISRGEYSRPDLAQSNAFFQVSINAKAPGLLYFDSGHGHDRMNWELDPYRQKAFVTEDHVYNEYPLDRMFFRKPHKATDPLPGSLQKSLFFMSTGIWPFTAREAPRVSGIPHVLREVALSTDSHWRLRPQLENVDGHWCHVLEQPGIDVLWLDLQRGCALLKRELYDQEQQVVSHQYRLKELKEMGHHIWLPTVIENTSFYKETQEGELKPYTRVTRIIECKVNQSSVADFEYGIPAGALELDQQDVRKQPIQVTPGGLEHFDSLASWIIDDSISTITRFQVGQAANLPASNKSMVNWYWVVGLITFTAIVGCEIYLMQKGRSCRRVSVQPVAQATTSSQLP